MTADELKAEAQALPLWQRHRFFFLVLTVIVISLFLVSVAMSLYNNSGAAQLDLSRPGYKDVRAQATNTKEGDNFSSSGDLDEKALKQFLEMYDRRANKVLGTGSFDPSVLSNESLQLLSGEPTSAEVDE